MIDGNDGLENGTNTGAIDEASEFAVTADQAVSTSPDIIGGTEGVSISPAANGEGAVLMSGPGSVGGEPAANDAETVDWQARAEAAEAALAEAQAENDDLKAKLEAADKAPKVTRGASGRKARKIKTDVSTATDAAALLDAIGKAETVEVLFCAGSAELTDPAPLTVAGTAWSASQFGLKLNAGLLLVTGSGPGATTIEGYALFLDGKQASYQARSDALSIPPGATFNLSDDVVFAA